MGRLLLSDGDVQGILRRVLEEKFSRTRPATRYFFNRQAPDATHPLEVSFHHWALATVSDADSRTTVEYYANRVVKEVADTANRILGELVFDKPFYIHTPPAWLDGHSLFSSNSVFESHRFGVIGGNVLTTTNSHVDDVMLAVRRLGDLDPEFDFRYERLLLFCAKPLEKDMIRACAKAGIHSKVFGIYHYKDERSWVLTRDESPCSLVIDKPAFKLPVEGNKMVIGARFAVWVDNPKNAVRVTT